MAPRTRSQTKDGDEYLRSPLEDSIKRPREDDDDVDETPARKRLAYDTPTRKPQQRAPKSAPPKLSAAELQRAELRRHRNAVIRKHVPLTGRRRTLSQFTPKHYDARLEPTRTPRTDYKVQEQNQTIHTTQNTPQNHGQGAGLMTSIWNWGTRIFGGATAAEDNHPQNPLAQNDGGHDAPERDDPQNQSSPVRTPGTQNHVEQNFEETYDDDVNSGSPEPSQRQPRYIEFPSNSDSPAHRVEEDDELWIDNTGLVPEQMSAKMRAEEVADQENFLLRRLSQKRAKINQDIDRLEDQIEDLEEVRDRASMEEEDFDPVQTPGTNKRKLAGVAGTTPRTSQSGFSPDTHEDHVSGNGESSSLNDSGEPATPTAKPRANNAQQAGSLTPRSVLRKPGTPSSTYRARFGINPVSSMKVFGNEGPAGRYTGNTFADPRPQKSPESVSSSTLTDSNFFSPRTMANTNANAFTPEPGRPRPGTFEVPYTDDYTDDEDDEDEEVTIITGDGYRKSTSMTIAPEDEHLSPVGGIQAGQPPSTPRPTHAELPPKTSSAFSSDTTFETSTSLSIEASSTAPVEAPSPGSNLEQLRKEAQRFRPRVSSSLSNVESFTEGDTTTSTLSSLPLSEGEERAMEATPFGRSLAVTPTQGQTTPAPFTPFPTTSITPGTKPTKKPLDNIIKGSDSMTDYEREHQYDDWARNLNWPEPQTYQESIGTDPYITNLINRRWTEEDTKRSRAFWQKEFDEVDAAMEDAKRQGKVLRLVVDEEAGVEI